MKDNLSVKGTVNLVLRGADGKVKEHRTIRNKVVNTGLYHIVGRLIDAGDRNDGNNTAPAGITYMGIGTGTTAAAATDVKLGTECSDSGYARVDMTASGRSSAEGIYTYQSDGTTEDTATAYTGGSRAEADRIKFVAVFGADEGEGAITEAGLFDVATDSAGDGSTQQMLCRTVFSAINKGVNDSLQITWTLTFASAS